MIDRPFGTYGQMLRSPDLRLADIRTELLRGTPPFTHRVADPERGFFQYARSGDFWLEIENSLRPALLVRQGTAIGVEDGRAHRWRSAEGADNEEPLELMISSIPRQMGVLQRLDDGVVVVPPDAQPFATIIGHAVELHLAEYSSGASDTDDAVIRRCAEICLIQFVRYAQSQVALQPNIPQGLAHDEHLLRAWSAYFAEPRRRWTVQTLADAAGLSRTAFAERFRKVFGAPPLHTLTMLRLKQAEAMLLHSQAPLIEIAFTVGYNSEAAFVRAFHREFGLPPGRFRDESRAAQDIRKA